MPNFKGRRQSKNVQDLRGREGTVSTWQVQANTKPMPEASPQVSMEMDRAAQIDRLKTMMRNRSRMGSVYGNILKGK